MTVTNSSLVDEASIFRQLLDLLVAELRATVRAHDLCFSPLLSFDEVEITQQNSTYFRFLFKKIHTTKVCRREIVAEQHEISVAAIGNHLHRTVKIDMD